MGTMEGLVSTLLTAAVVFASTNVDDLVLLSVMFADPQLRPRAIVLGKFVGIGILVLVSVAASVAAVAVPSGWTALLGAIPLGIGAIKLIRLFRTRTPDNEPGSVDVSKQSDRSAITAVVGITLANGADNLSVYVPLFAANRAAVSVYVCVFAVLTGVWCWLGHRLVSNRILGEKIRRYGHIALPLVLIGLGIHILVGALDLLR